MANKKKQLRVDLDPELHKKVKAKALEQDTTITNKVTELLTNYIK